jgi:16S rRNA (guanine966-N2)-methyltransferase
MRIIGGKCRGRKLEVVQGRTVRPVRDAVREALFNILGEAVAGKKVLDLYAGSGSLGIEALSRGAEGAVFVESDPETARVLTRNLETMGLEGEGILIREDVLGFLSSAGTSDNRGGFHLVLADPPFAFSGSADISKLVGALKPGPLWGAGDLVAVLEVEEKGARFEALEKLPGDVEFRPYGRNLLCIARHSG